jgi:hypothetical protein
VLFDLWIRDPE